MYRQLVPPDSVVLEIGCGRGELLASLQPRVGVGVDFSGEALKVARARHPDLHFVQGDAHAIPLRRTFDYVICSDLLNDLWDVQAVLERLRDVSHRGTRIMINIHSHLWEIPLTLVKRAGLSTPVLPQNWLTVGDVRNLLTLSGWETVRVWPDVLFPLDVPLFAPLLNRFVGRLWPFYFASVVNFVVARPAPERVPGRPRVSVVVPARNEAGRIDEIVNRIPDWGGGTEIIFVEGHSKDDTYEAIRRASARVSGRNIRMFRQTGEGKGDAVRLGFEQSTGDILAILDADLTVAPEDLPRFCEALASGRAEFANGVRLVYPMEQRAMRFMNLVANKTFGWIFSWILGQPVKDTLCGTKVLWRTDYEAIASNRHVFGDFDPFGDFDLLFGAARLNRRIVDVPVRYRERTYGTTNIRRWRHGVLLARMAMLGAARLRFI